MARKQIQTFGSRLKALREAAGLSRPELGTKAGLTRQYVYELERDTKAVSWAVVLQLCDALGVTPNDFLPPKALNHKGHKGHEERQGR